MRSFKYSPTTFVCLKCGRALTAAECLQKGRWLIRQQCPDCQVPVCLPGSTLIAIGMLWLFLWSMVLCAEGPIIAIVGGSGFMIIGLLRIFIRIQAQRRTAEAAGTAKRVAGWEKGLAVGIGIVLCDLFGFVLVHTLPIFKLAPICATVSILGFLAGVAGFIVFTGWRSVGKAIALALVTVVMSFFLLVPFVPAALHGWGSRSVHEVKLFLAGSAGNAGTHIDRYGGRYHLGPAIGSQRIVYSEGPDGKDGGGKNQAIQRLGKFEQPFKQLYPRPFSTLQAVVREATLREATQSHFLDGDIVWTVDADGKIEPQGGWGP